MKRIFILHILFLFILGLNAQMYSTSSYVQQERHYVKPPLNTQEHGYTNGARIGYTTQYSDVYNPSENVGRIQQEYEGTPTTRSGGPRKAPWDHANGSATVTVDGYSATVTWDVDAAFLGIIYWEITYSDGTTEIFEGSFGEVKQMAENPDEPYADPLTDGILVLIMFALLYCSVLYRKKKTDY